MHLLKSRQSIFILLLWLLAISNAPPVWSQVSVTNEGYDNAHTGSNLSETILNTSNVNVNQFGKLFTYTVDGSVFAQPLYVPNVSIPGNGTHNVLYVATMNDVVYAFDADNNSATNASPLWSVDLRNPSAGVTAVPIVDIVGTNDGNIVGNVGIESTPCIDLASNTMYLLARTLENGSFVQRLHALDITTGAEKFSGPTTITASVTGSGNGNVNGTLTFDPQIENQRAALAVSNGMVFIAWASHGDLFDFHGWVMAYDAQTLQQVTVNCITPNGSDGGIWMAGRGPVVDAAGNVYYMTANGDWDGIANFGDSFMKFTPGTDTFSLTDWFTPDNWLALSEGDIDLGSSGPLLIPGTNLLVGGGKAGTFYVVSTANMGHEWAFNTQIVQSFSNGGGSLGPVYYNRGTSPGPWMYAWGFNHTLNAYHFNGTTFDTTPISQSTFPAASGSFPAALAVTANGSVPGTGILWASMPPSPDSLGGVVGGVIRAFDAGNLTNELWDSLQNPTRDDIGTWAKFRSPVVANGKLYMGSFSNTVAVYGLLSTTPDFTLSPSPASASFAPGGSASYTINVGALNGFSGAVSFTVTGLPSGASASFNPPTITGSGATTLTVTTAGNTPLDSSMLTITGTSNSISHGETVTLLAPTPDFTLTPSPPSATFAPGGSANYAISIGSLYGFAGTVSLGVSGLPAGATASFNPPTVNGSGTSTLTIATAANTLATSSTLTITGVSGFLSETTSAILTPVVSISPTTVTLVQNGALQTQQFTAVVQNSASQSVNWSINPSVGSISPSGLYTAPPATVNQSLTVTATSTADSTKFGFATISLTVPATATFSFADTITQGNWQGTYGSDGYSIAQSVQILPGYASFALANQLNFIWTTGTSDPRALQLPGGGGGIASAWYSPAPFTLDVNLTDGNSHVISVYAVDWDSKGRAETVQIVDANTGTVLDTRSIAGFTDGVYLVWRVSGHVQINVTSTAGANGVVSGIFFGGNSSGGSETVSLSPATVSLAAGGSKQFAATVTNGTSQTVTWSISAVTPAGAPQGSFSSTTPGLYAAPATINEAETITVMATSSDGTASGTATVNLSSGAGGGGTTTTVTFVPPPDTTTQGNWQSTYGTDGYDLANVTPANVPSYAAFAVQNQLNYTWDASTSDPRALQNPNGSGGIAATWYSNAPYSFTLSFNDGATHLFAIYAVDWDGKGRTENIQILDANTNAQLDSQTLANFGNGAYLVWNISGSVKINVTTIGGPNAVVSGVFFGRSSNGGTGTETVTVSPTSASLAGGVSKQFTATVANGTGQATWAITAVNPAGAAQGTLSSTTPGLYTAPGTVTVATTVTLTATSADGAASGTATISLSPTVTGSGTTVAFVSPPDTSTSGSWQAKYGSDGYVMANVTPTAIPAYANFSVQNALAYTWSSSTSDPRALQIPKGSGGIAAAWYSSAPYSFNLSFTDGLAHQVAIYAVDWDNKGRVETIQIFDAVTNNQLDNRTLSGFATGTYLVWTISGNVTIVVTSNAGPNAVVSGFFFASSATFPVINVTGGTPQSAQTGTAFAPLIATIAGGSGSVSGVQVTFAAPGSGPSGTFPGGTSTATATTNAQGVATAPTFTANTTPGGPYTVTATAAGIQTPADFLLTNSSQASSPASVTASGGTPQSASVSSAFATQLQATVEDALSNPIPNITVTFTAPTTGTSGTFAGGLTTATAVTNSQGIALASPFTANTSIGGPYAVTAAVSGVTTSATFLLTNTAASGCGGNCATFVSKDTTTEGNWNPKYGADGYSLANATQSIPGYATLTPQNEVTYTWNSGTNDPRALLIPGSTSGIASAWYNTSSFSFALNMGSNFHQLAIYALDWDNLGRSETIQIQDASTGAPLDTETISNFGAGVYLVWNISGQVKIVVTATNGPNAVVSGVFFGGAPPAAAAAFVTKDTTTEGAWQTHYGADGYALANVTAQVVPAYASLAVQNQTNYTWTATTTDMRALQIPGGQGGIAAAWYSPSSFYVDINVGTSLHEVSLYALDWDGQGRAETIQIVDANSGSVLDTETLSTFSGGVYVVWNITGHVRAVVTLAGGPNAVISGAFFN